MDARNLLGRTYCLASNPETPFTVSSITGGARLATVTVRGALHTREHPDYARVLVSTMLDGLDCGLVRPYGEGREPVRVLELLPRLAAQLDRDARSGGHKA